MSQLYTMPVPPQEGTQDSEFYQTFVRSMNRVSVKKATDRIRQAIERTADACDTSPAYIARILVEYGLRAPRHVFPNDFTSFIDDRSKVLKRLNLPLNGEITELAHFWAGTTEVSPSVGTKVVETV